MQVRAESLNLKEISFSYNPESIAHNEKILRLFIRLASETANHLIRLKREINAHQDSRLNRSESAIGTKVSVGEKKDSFRSDLGVKVAKQGQMRPNTSEVANGTVTTENSSVQPIIEIANRLMSDVKENKTSTAANGTTVSDSADQLSRKAETQLAPQINGTDGFVGQSGKVGNETGGSVARTVVPSASVGPAPIGQLSHSPTVPSSISQPQIMLKGQGEGMGNGTLTPPTSVASSSAVKQVPNGRRSSVPTVPNSDSKTPFVLNNQSGQIGNETAPTLQKPFIKNPRDNQLPVGQPIANRTKQLGTKNGIAPGVPKNSGLPMNPNHMISAIPNIINGTIGSLMLLGQDTGSQNRAQPNGVAFSPSQTPTGQVDSNPKRSSTAGSQVAGVVPFYRSIPNLINPTTSVPSTATKNPGSPADANQMIASLEDVNEKMGKMLLVDPNNPGDPNDPHTMILQDPSIRAMGELNYAKHQAIGELIKSVKPMFRSFPDVQDKLPGNNKTSNAIKELVEKNGTVAQSQSLGSAGSNASQHKLLELELHNYVNKFLDALRPLDSGKITASKTPAVK